MGNLCILSSVLNMNSWECNVFGTVSGPVPRKFLRVLKFFLCGGGGGLGACRRRVEALQGIMECCSPPQCTVFDRYLFDSKRSGHNSGSIPLAGPEITSCNTPVDHVQTCTPVYRALCITHTTSMIHLCICKWAQVRYLFRQDQEHHWTRVRFFRQDQEHHHHLIYTVCKAYSGTSHMVWPFHLCRCTGAQVRFFRQDQSAALFQQNLERSVANGHKLSGNANSNKYRGCCGKIDFFCFVFVFVLGEIITLL